MSEPRYYRGIEVKAPIRLHEQVLEIIQALPGKDVLDIASGPGAMSQRLFDAGYNVSAMDIMCSFAFEGCCQIPYYKIDLNELNWNVGGGSWDIAISLETIEHLENPRNFLRNLQKRVKPGGYIILSTPNLEAPQSKAWFLFKNQFGAFKDQHYEVHHGHITPVTELQMRQICGELDLTLEKVYLSQYHPFILWDSWWDVVVSLLINTAFYPLGQKGISKIYQIKVRDH